MFPIRKHLTIFNHFQITSTIYRHFPGVRLLTFVMITINIKKTILITTINRLEAKTKTISVHMENRYPGVFIDGREEDWGYLMTVLHTEMTSD